MSALDAVNAEWRRICGPWAKPPKLNALAFPIVARPGDFASMKVALDDFMRQIDHATRPADHMMEDAVRMAFVLGYQPADCRIDIQRGVDSLDAGSVETRRLIVREAPCFEVEIRRSPMVDLKFTITATPRLIAWPPDISTPAHQHPRTIDAP